MKKPLFILILLFTGRPGFAQISQNKQNLQQHYIQQSEVCGGVAELFKKKGIWKKSAYGDDLSFPDKAFPANQQNLLLSRIEKVLPIMKEAIPDLGGLEPEWYGSIRGNSFVANGPVPSSFQCSFFTYSCNTNANKISPGDETSTWLYVFFNSYGFFCNKIVEWNINDDGKMISIYQKPDSIGKWKGVTLYEPKISIGGPGLPTDRAVVLVHNGQMPWHTLTQKQYLTGYKNWLLKKKKEQLEGNDVNLNKMKENIANMQASKTFTPEQKKSIVEKLEQQLKEFQDNTIQKNMAASEKIFNDMIKPVQDYLDTATAQTLNQPAILDIKSNTQFKGYFAKTGQPGIKLFNFTNKYFNSALNRYVPQFIVLYWKWGQDPPSLKFAQQMEENFPIEKLKALIDQ